MVSEALGFAVPLNVTAPVIWLTTAGSVLTIGGAATVVKKRTFPNAAPAMLLAAAQ